MLNQEAESNTAAEDRDGWVYLLAVLLWFVGIVIGGKIMLSILHHEEKPLSDVKAWGLRVWSRCLMSRVSISRKFSIRSTRLTRT